jgi:hypothetical protein
VKRLHLVSCVWGDKYLDLFLNYCIPSLLAPGNLPSAPGRCRMMVVTRAEDKPKITDHPHWKLLGKYAEQRIEVLNAEGGDWAAHRYEIISVAHRRAYEMGFADGSAVGIVCPDNVYASGYVARLLGWLDAGKRLVLQFGLRAAYESLAPQLQHTNGVLTIPPRLMVRAALHHIHPLSWACLYDNPYFTRLPYLMHWNVEGQGFLTRSFVATPAMAVPTRETAGFSATVDFDLERHMGPISDAEIVFVDDSDDLCTCELNFLENFWPPYGPNRASPDVIARWAQDQFTPLNWKYLQRPIRWHWQDIDQPRWDRAQARSDAAIAAINSAAGR